MVLCWLYHSPMAWNGSKLQRDNIHWKVFMIYLNIWIIYLLNLDREVRSIDFTNHVIRIYRICDIQNCVLPIGGLNVSRKFARTLWTSYGLSCWDWECSIYEMKSIHFSSHFPALVFNSQSFHSISVNVGQATRFYPIPKLSFTLTSRRKLNQRLTPINPYQISVFINSMNPLTYDQNPQFLVATQKQW